MTCNVLLVSPGTWHMTRDRHVQSSNEKSLSYQRTNQSVVSRLTTNDQWHVMNVLHEWSLFWHYPSKIVARSPLTRWLFCHLNCDPDGSNQKIYSFVKSDKCSVEILLWISKWYFDKRGHKGWSYLLALRRIKCNSSNNKSLWRQRLSKDNPESYSKLIF